MLPIGEHTSRFVWAEVVVVPLGALGSLAWRIVRPVAERVVDRALAAMRDGVERESRDRRADRPGESAETIQDGPGWGMLGG